jgi:hypothetical protein
VDVTTEKSRDGKSEFVREVHLVKGELLQPGKPLKTGGKSGESTDQHVYKSATIKEYKKPYLTVTADDKDVKVMVSNSLKVIDSAGKPVAKNDKMSSLKPGKVVDLTTRTLRDKEAAVEIRFQGD